MLIGENVSAKAILIFRTYQLASILYNISNVCEMIH